MKDFFLYIVLILGAAIVVIVPIFQIKIKNIVRKIKKFDLELQPDYGKFSKLIEGEETISKTNISFIVVFLNRLQKMNEFRMKSLKIFFKIDFFLFVFSFCFLVFILFEEKYWIVFLPVLSIVLESVNVFRCSKAYKRIKNQYNKQKKFLELLITLNQIYRENSS